MNPQVTICKVSPIANRRRAASQMAFALAGSWPGMYRGTQTDSSVSSNLSLGDTLQGAEGVPFLVEDRYILLNAVPEQGLAELNR
jgi:hypothetical protein